jgi:hypothetical protein
VSRCDGVSKRRECGQLRAATAAVSVRVRASRHAATAAIHPLEMPLAGH